MVRKSLESSLADIARQLVDQQKRSGNSRNGSKLASRSNVVTLMVVSLHYRRVMSQLNSAEQR